MQSSNFKGMMRKKNMTELVSMKHMPKEVKIELLKKLGCKSDGKFVLDKNGKKILHACKCAHNLEQTFNAHVSLAYR
jgi:hypothetical protein